MLTDPQFWFALFQIAWINILLSGDNAVVIALACRSLPPRQQKLGIVLGTGPAVILRIVFAVFIVHLMTVPFLKIAGGLLLLWIAIQMLQPEDEAGEAELGATGAGADPGMRKTVRSSTSLFVAARTIVAADAVMSLDNVIAIAGAAEQADPSHRLALVIFGLVVSVPIIVWGSTLVLKLLDRFPIVVALGAGLLGWIAGGLMVHDPVGDRWPVLDTSAAVYGASIAGALFVVAAGYALRRRRAVPHAH